MSSDEDVGEAFEITEEDLANEFNPKFRKQSKEERLYGVFSDEDRAGFGARGPGGQSNGAGYKPMSFVSAGTAPQQDDAEAADSDTEDAATNQAIIDDLGAPAPAPAPAPAAEASAQPAVPERPSFSAKKAATTPARRTSNPFAKGEQKRLRPSSVVADNASTMAAKSAAPPKYSMFGSKKDNKVDKEFGKWQKASTGFGQKYLEKFGWKVGQGAGSTGHGIVEPIEVKLRKAKMGLQNNGERTAQSRRDFDKGESAEAKTEKFKEELAQWRSKDADRGRTKKPKYVFKSVDDLVAEGGETALGMAAAAPRRQEKVIDMTQAQPRVLDGYHQISQTSQNQNAGPAMEQGVSMPELQNNIAVLANHAASDVVRFSTQIKKEKSRQKGLREEREKTADRISKRSRYISRLAEIVQVVQGYRDRLTSTSNPIGLAEVAESLTTLRNEYPEEYTLYGLSKLAEALTFPLLKQQLQGWAPFDGPDDHIAFVESLREILDDRNPANGSGTRELRTREPQVDADVMNQFEGLCWNLVLPPIRVALSTWDPRQPRAAIAMVLEWQPVLPDWITDNIREQLVLPRMQAAVDGWDPLTDQIPLHSWLQPWVPILGSLMDPLYPTVRYKLSSCLQAWHPSDASARQMLKPWVSVFARKDMAVLLSRSILPKLAMVLRELAVDPTQQDLAPFRWVVSWSDVVAPTEMARMLSDTFFPKFISALCSWLSQDGANLAEIAEWYSGWKRQMDGAVLAAPAVRGYLARALDLMNRTALTALGEPVPERRHLPPKRIAPVPVQKPLAGGAGLSSVRELVQSLADSNGLPFMPKAGRTTDNGDQLYLFGKLSLYIQQGVVYTRKTRTDPYAPVSVDALPNMAR